jgi:HPt (histidine-containing phosphotransfer) domain-containing protein
MTELLTLRVEDSYRAAVDQLLETCGAGGEEVVASLIEMFLADAPCILADLRRGVADGAAEEVRRAAHTLKSHGMTFGAPLLAHVAREVEVMAREGDLIGAAGLVAEVQAEYERAREALDAVRRQLLVPVPAGLAA